MTYKEERQARERRLYSKQAIALAMQGRWEEAVAANRKIIEAFPHDLDAFNRLGRAFMELGEYTLAAEAYGQSMQLDPANTIAAKNLQRLLHLGGSAGGARAESRHAEPHHFIEEIGKAGVVSLYNLAPPEVLVRMVAGNEVSLRINGARLTVENSRGAYLGQVESRPAQRLIRLMEGGNRYTAAVISSAEDRLTVIIRETYQDPSQVGQLSFPPRGVEKIQSYVSGRVLRREMEEDDLSEDSTDVYEDITDEE